MANRLGVRSWVWSGGWSDEDARRAAAHTRAAGFDAPEPALSAHAAARMAATQVLAS